MAVSALCCPMQWMLLFLIVGQSWAFATRQCHSSVGIGQTVYLSSKTLAIKQVTADEICKVEVMKREPMTQRVGQLRPEIFSCLFLWHSVTYTHFGSVALSEDLVRLHVLYFATNATRIEAIDLHISIEPSPYSAVAIKRYLRVKNFFGLSRPIDHRVLHFRNKSSLCQVGHGDSETAHYIVRRLPSYGRLVTGRNRQPLVGVVEQPCTLLMHWGLRYKHTKPPTPNVDYVLLRVRTPDASDPAVFHLDWVQLRVIIETAFVNLPPVIDPGSTLFLAGCPFSSVPLTTEILRAKDEESPSEELIFTLTNRSTEERGHLCHVSDPNWAISSFRQADLMAQQIVYHFSFVGLHHNKSLDFQLELNVVDADFLSSTVPVFIRVLLNPCASRISLWATVNVGIVLYEGQRRQVLPHNFRVIPLSSSVKFTVVEGPTHGQLTVNGHLEKDFTWSDLQQGTVWYTHDDSDTTDDAVYLRVADGSPDVHLKFPISIVPKDDSPPLLVVNLGLQVDEGQTVILNPRCLLATDRDSPDDDIVYLITQPPSAGYILKRSGDHSFGLPISDFTQSNLRALSIIYVHNKGKIFSDHFELVLRDRNVPVANESPRYRVVVDVKPAPDADPPRMAPRATLSAMVNETDVLFLNRQMMHYVDLNVQDDSIVYRITSRPHPISDRTFTDGGKLVFLDLSLDSTKEELLHAPEITEFRQKHVDDLRVVYVPPRADVGPTLLDVGFVYSVSDGRGNHLNGQHFNISLLPVNNKKPAIITNPLMVEEGNSSILSGRILIVHDPDTPLHDLDMWLQSSPSSGTISLNTSPLAIGQIFTMLDVEDSHIRYTHNGAEVFEDRVTIMVSDQVHSVGSILDIRIVPVDDEAMIVPESDDFVGLSINEGDRITITQEVLSSFNLGVNVSGVYFAVVDDPKYGELLVGGKRSHHFSENNVTNGLVQYVHNGREIGLHSKLDDLHFVLSDERRSYADRGRSGSADPSVTLRITILPIDNVPPELHAPRPIHVYEGGKVTLESGMVTVRDEDSPGNKITLILNVNPKYGFLENVATPPGSEISGIGKKIISFTLRDLESGLVNYVQAMHRMMEPELDSFSLYAIDGVQRSAQVLFNVSILPQNDEEPQACLQNFTISQGSNKLIDAEIFNVSDLDRPADNVTVFLKVPPIRGKLIVGERALIMQSPRHRRRKQFMTYLAWEDFDPLGVVYQHDGLTTDDDFFTFWVTDGKHKVMLSSVVTFTRTIPVRPEMIINKELKGVRPGSHRLITNGTLMAKATALPVHYKVRRNPQFGRLQRLTGVGQLESNYSWTDLTDEPNPVFSQLDIDEGRIRYVLEDVPFQKWTADNFTFVLVSDHIIGEPQLFKIEVVNFPPVDLNFTVGSVVVMAEGMAIIGPLVVSVNPNSIDAEHATFYVSAPPSHGFLAYIQFSNRPICSFSFVDVLGQQVVYVHMPHSRSLEQSEDSEDHFEIVLANNVTGQNFSSAEVSVHIVSHGQNPTTSLPQTLPSVRVSGRWVIDSRSMAGRLTSNEILATYPNHSILVTEFPRLGHLFVGNRILGSPSNLDSIFTQEEIDDGLVSYRRRPGVIGELDHFSFRLHGIGLVKDGWQGDDYRLNIVMSSPPTRRTVKLELHSPTLLEDLGDGQQGFIFTAHHIRVLSSSLPTGDFNLTMRKRPIHGRIAKLQIEGKLEGIGHFTTRDIGEGSICYVLNRTIRRSTADSFELSIIDSDGTTIALSSMDLHWSLLYFGQTEYDVCEDVGMVGIAVHRSSHLEHSSFVDVRAVSSSAEALHDFRESNVRQIFFGPGSTTVIWEILILVDGLEENAIETFFVQLSNPINAVIDSETEVIVRIHDKQKGSCFQSLQSEGRPVDRLPSTPAKDNFPLGCDATTVGMSLQITHGKLNLDLICDGKSWVSSGNATEVSGSGKSSPPPAKTRGERRKNKHRQPWKNSTVPI